MSPLIQSWLLQSFVIFLMVGSVAGMVAGALLLMHPHRLQGISQLLNRWISTRHLNQSLDRSVNLDPWFYRYRRTSGTLILLCALFILYHFTAGIDRTDTIAGLARYLKLPPVIIGGLLDALVLSALSGGLLAAFVGMFLLLRPSMLRDFEQVANQWISFRRGLKPMEVARKGVDEYVFQRARQAGALLVLGGLYTLVMLAIWLSRYSG